MRKSGKVKIWEHSDASSESVSKSLGKIVAIEDISIEGNKFEMFLVVGDNGIVELWKWSEKAALRLSSSTFNQSNVRNVSTKWIDGVLYLALSRGKKDPQLLLYTVDILERHLELKIQRKFSHSKGKPIGLDIIVDVEPRSSTYAIIVTLEIDDGVNKQCQTFRDIRRKYSSVNGPEVDENNKNNKDQKTFKSTKAEYVVSGGSEEKYCVLPGAEGEVLVRDSAGQETVMRLHSRRVTGLAWVARGELVTSGEEGKVKSWRVGEPLTGAWQQTGELSGAGQPFTCLAGGEGGRIIIGDEGGNVYCLKMRKNSSN